MRRAFAVILPFVLAGCGVDTTGLGDDIVEDSGDDTTISSDETGTLFDADETSGEDSDATLEETTAETSAETGEETSAETSSEPAEETGTDADAESDSSDGAIDETSLDGDLGDGDASVDSAVDAPADAPDETATDSGVDTAPTDTGSTGLVSTPGQTSCSHSGTAKLCTSSSDYCCGTYDLFSLSWKWDCSGSCIAGRDYKCDEKADCGSGKICCAKVSLIGSTIQGSDCRSSCGSDPQLCMTTTECAGGKTCTPQKAPDSPQTIGVCK
ncbi:MAG: hypothetical protein ACXWUG_07630 [Polyangiales bacterium]